MIQIQKAGEPNSFDAKVRQKGLRAIAELVGETTKRRGRPRKDRGRYASRTAIPPNAYTDYWTAAIPDLRRSYKSLCAYLALYIHKAVGSATVDHFVPKSKDWSRVYEWDNYRLCASIVNGTKGDHAVPFDPFTLQAGLFALEFVEYQVVPGPAVPEAMVELVEAAITTLGLNLRDCREAREEYVVEYRCGPPKGIAFERLELHAPFIAQELRRQGLLVRGD